MTEVSIRYYGKTNTYYVEIRDEGYFEADKKLRRIGKELNRIPADDTARRPFLEARRETLRKLRQDGQRYLPIPEEEIPPGVKIRPIYALPKAAEPLPAAQRQKLLLLLRGKESPAEKGN